ncbi:FAD/NAD(P)-binding domain-containing protein [Apiospora arundinis]|uniref:FAD/NAD(P)-binding domain-containing protein n=1 Tax=Apiospora arundinis TaxID=335852 RepID=A0ABR2I7Z9_9PEZI
MPASGAIKRVAVIGAGPAGAITIDALAQEKAFETIRVFERREAPGGCWLGDNNAPPPLLSDFESLANRTADAPLEDIPAFAADGNVGKSEVSPVRTARPKRHRWTEPHIYPYLETNVSDLAMQFNAEPIAAERSARSVALHGADTPFRHWDVLRRYVDGLVRRHEQQSGCSVSYNTTVERVEKVGGEWKVTLRKEETGEEEDAWWVEWFDAVVVASGHYSVPYVPAVEGLEEMQRARPGSVLHSKHYRGRDAYRNKVRDTPTIFVMLKEDWKANGVGLVLTERGRGRSFGFVTDIAFDLAEVAASTHAVIIGHTMNRYFGDGAFQHPRIHQCPSIKRVTTVTRGGMPAPEVQVELIDGTVIPDVDHIIFGTGFSWTLPFFSSPSPSTSEEEPKVPTVRNNRVPDLWQHVVWRHDPTLLFVGAVGAGLTFKIFEWQAVLAARLLAGRCSHQLPSCEEMRQWEADRIASHGDGPGFTLVHPEFEAYFETLRRLTQGGEEGESGGKGIKGRQLPPFDPAWFAAFMDGHELRKRMWERLNAEAAAAKVEESSSRRLSAAHL